MEKCLKLAIIAFFLLFVTGPTLGNNNVISMKSDETKVDDEIASMKAIMKEVAKEEVTEAFNNYKQEIMSRKLGLNLKEAVEGEVLELVANAKDKMTYPPNCVGKDKLCTPSRDCCTGFCDYGRREWPYGYCS
ncbi:UvrABC system protein B [Bienertia sinuspersici]